MAKRIGTTGRPSRVKVGPHWYEVDWFSRTQSDASEKYGYCHMTDLQIGICEHMPKSRQRQTMLHEVLHAIHETMGLDDKSPEEDFTHRVAAGLALFITDNLAVWAWIGNDT